VAGDASEQWDEDPGWPARRSLFVILPGGTYFARKDKDRLDALAMIRLLYTAFATAIVWFAVVVLFTRQPQRGSVTPWLVAIVAVALIALAVSKVVERPLDCETDVTLATSFRIRFFVRVACAEAAALFAFFASFVNGPGWIFLVGAALSLARMTAQAPTRAALQRDQDTLSANGCTRSLVAALRQVRSS
jgi:hypothetical protein